MRRGVGLIEVLPIYRMDHLGTLDEAFSAVVT